MPSPLVPVTEETECAMVAVSNEVQSMGSLLGSENEGGIKI